VLKVLQILFLMDVKAQWRQKVITLLPLFLFSLWIGLFLFLFENSPALTPLFKSQCLWLFLIFTLLFTLHRQYESDLQTGLLDLVRSQSWPLEYYILIKMVSGWGFVCLPLLLLSIGGIFILSPEEALYGSIGLFISGTLAIHALVSFGSILTLQNTNKGLLLPFLLLPFCIPVAIMGLGGIEAAFHAQSSTPSLLLLTSFFLALIPINCLLGASYLKHLCP